MGKKWGKKLGFFSLCLTLMFSLLFGISNSQAATFANGKTTNKYTKEEIFQGIFFGAGAFGKQVYKDALKQLSKEQQDAMNSKDFKQAIDTVTNFIAKEDPAYLDELQTAVASKNPYQVDQSLQKGGHMLYTAFHDHAKELNLQAPAGTNAPTVVNGNCLVWALGVVAVYYLVAAGQVAVAALYVGGAEVYLVASSVQYVSQAVSATPVHDNNFGKEQLVQSIVTAY